MPPSSSAADSNSRSSWLRRSASGYRLQIRLTPKAARDEIGGLEQTDNGQIRLKASVRAVPEKGRANKALIALLAKRCGIARSRIRFVSGETSRLKVLEIECDEETLRACLAESGAL